MTPPAARRATPSPLLRYVLLQIPGFVVTSLVLWLAYQVDFIAARTGLVVLTLSVLKDVAFYPLIRHSLSSAKSSVGVDRVLDKVAVVEEDLKPVGIVRIFGERWRAEGVDGPIGRGQQVRVVAVSGLTLRVRQLPPPE